MGSTPRHRCLRARISCYARVWRSLGPTCGRQVQPGEGVYGLRRALLLAGAQTQLVSLWKVADAATQELMIDYYQRLLKGEGRSAALRTAQEAMMADLAHQHPYYWAAFIAIGDWTPLLAGR